MPGAQTNRSLALDTLTFCVKMSADAWSRRGVEAAPLFKPGSSLHTCMGAVCPTCEEDFAARQSSELHVAHDLGTPAPASSQTNAKTSAAMN